MYRTKHQYKICAFDKIFSLYHNGFKINTKICEEFITVQFVQVEDLLVTLMASQIS